MPHSKKWTEAHAKVSAKAPTTIYGYTPDQWDAAKAQFTAHLYTDAAMNDEPIDDTGATPNSVVAEVSARSEKGALYVTEFVDAGLLSL
jgi:hypothetical protein